MNRYKSVSAYIAGEKVGTLAASKEHLVVFEYDPTWISNGYSISPYSLPLRSGVFAPKKYDPFDGLFGVFADSLPDGWGRLLVDRLLKKEGINPAEVDAVTRLSIVGSSGMGALEYIPEQRITEEWGGLSVDELASECSKLFDTDESEHLDELFLLGGSSGGARPKVYYNIDGEEWIIKFPSSLDRPSIGVQEYQYSRCAKKCGINMPETRLLPSDLCEGYFAVKRFDRQKGGKIHMVSVSGMLETSHRIPNLDYDILMQLTMQLTNSYQEIEQLYRLMCFNVFAHNRDDHSKNFSFLYHDNRWQLSPAYDLTYSNSIGGEHATTVHGEGRNPGFSELLAVADVIKFDKRKAKNIADEIYETVLDDLREWI